MKFFIFLLFLPVVFAQGIAVSPAQIDLTIERGTTTQKTVVFHNPTDSEAHYQLFIPDNHFQYTNITLNPKETNVTTINISIPKNYPLISVNTTLSVVQQKNSTLLPGIIIPITYTVKGKPQFTLSQITSNFIADIEKVHIATSLVVIIFIVILYFTIVKSQP